ncbi:MAG: hypothetical protein NVSMB32_01900 [Actinomycetota bacterium]
MRAIESPDAKWAAPLARLRGRAHCMDVDCWTAEVFGAFAAEGIQAVLLKGPVIARWLYAADPDSRFYCDVDVLVHPAQLGRAQDVLRRLGFDNPLHPEWLLPHAREWVRASDGARVDLHRTLHALEHVSPELIWDEITATAERCEVAGIQLDAPGMALRALHVALHARPGDDPASQASEDLRRAAAQVDAATWRRAANLAGQFGVSADMGQRLRTCEGGAAIADGLGLPASGSLKAQVLAGIERHALPESLFLFGLLASIPTYRGKLRWVLRRQFPDPRYMRSRYRTARRGHLGLGTAYCLRAVQSLVLLPRAAWHWATFKRGIGRRE